MTMPAPEPNGFVKTLNNMGFMTSTLDPFSKAFAQYAAHAPGPALEVGAAYGIATLEALEQGAKVFANDIDFRHLDILASRVPPAFKECLTLMPGRFPEDLNFHSNSLGSVLIARVLHFFPGSMIERAAEKLHQWLSPGGKVFVVAETPYLKSFQDFIPIYEKRVQEGQPWPGFIDDVMKLDPVRGLALPKQMHFLDPAVLYHVDVLNHVVKVKIMEGVEKTEMTLERPNPTMFERIQQWIGERIYGEYVVYLKTNSGVTKEGVWVFYFPKKSTAKDGNKYDLKIMDYRFPALESEMKNNRIAYASCSPRA